MLRNDIGFGLRILSDCDPGQALRDGPQANALGRTAAI